MKHGNLTLKRSARTYLRFMALKLRRITIFGMPGCRMIRPLQFASSSLLLSPAHKQDEKVSSDPDDYRNHEKFNNRFYDGDGLIYHTILMKVALLEMSLTSLPSVLSNKTTRPPRSPVAKCSPVLSNSIAEMMSTATFNILYNKTKTSTDQIRLCMYVGPLIQGLEKLATRLAQY